MMHNWDAKQYLQFENERTRPACDLAMQITVKDPYAILDIGCGPGNSTAVLREQFPNANIIGIDNAPDMIAKAQETYPDMTFMCVDVFEFMKSTDVKYNVVFSNACLQWLPDHQALIPSLMNLLKDGGVLAVQMPNNYHEPIHRIIEMLTTSEKWRPHFHVMREKNMLSVSGYYDCLTKTSSRVDLWETAYHHTLSSHQDLLEWYRGTGLRPYLEQLSANDKQDFEKEFLAAVKESYPMQADDTILFRFPRLFFIATK